MRNYDELHELCSVAHDHLKSSEDLWINGIQNAKYAMFDVTHDVQGLGCCDGQLAMAKASNNPEIAQRAPGNAGWGRELSHRHVVPRSWLWCAPTIIHRWLLLSKGATRSSSLNGHLCPAGVAIVDGKNDEDNRAHPGCGGHYSVPEWETWDVAWWAGQELA